MGKCPPYLAVLSSLSTLHVRFMLYGEKNYFSCGSSMFMHFYSGKKHIKMSLWTCSSKRPYLPALQVKQTNYYNTFYVK